MAMSTFSRPFCAYLQSSQDDENEEKLIKDVVANFLATLHANSKPQYQGISENACEIYSEQGRLSVKLHAWAIKAAGFQKVKVPTEFHDAETYDAAVQFDGTHSAASISKEVLATRIAALHDTAVILNNAANKLRTI